MTIVEFLQARLDEDEAVARHLMDGDPEPIEVHDTMPHNGVAFGMWIYDDDRRHDTLAVDPARVRREAAAKRAIIDQHRPPRGDDTCNMCREIGPDAQGWPCDTVRHLAAVYADHPDYQEAWRP